MNTENSCSAPERFLNYCHATVWTLFISVCVILVCLCKAIYDLNFYFVRLVLFCCYRCRNRAKTLVSDVALEIQQRQRFQELVDWSIFFDFWTQINQIEESRTFRRFPKQCSTEYSPFRPAFASDNDLKAQFNLSWFSLLIAKSCRLTKPFSRIRSSMFEAATRKWRRGEERSRCSSQNERSMILALLYFLKVMETVEKWKDACQNAAWRQLESTPMKSESTSWY